MSFLERPVQRPPTCVLPSCASIDRSPPRHRPAGPAIGYHHWSDLLFIHWRMPESVVRPLLPAGLELDTWEGEAWVGLVLFYMSGVRPWWSPPCPGISRFCETNVRTYVYQKGGAPGVWFFSLEAESSIAVRVARLRWHLPYYRAAMSLVRDRRQRRYESRRLWPGEAGAGCQVEATIGASGGTIEPAVLEPCTGLSLPGTLEHFLVERYVLYSRSNSGRLLRARVHHDRYRLETVQIDRLDDTLLAAAGMPPEGDPVHAVYCAGVSVDIFPLEEVG